MRRIPRPWVIGAGLAATAVLGAGVSFGGIPAPRFLASTVDTVAGHAGDGPAQVGLDVTPAPNAKNLPITTEIGTKATGGKVDAVTLTERGGGQVSGGMRADGSSWIPDDPLKLGKTYTAQVTAKDSEDRAVTRTTTFSTMKSADNRIDTTVNMDDNGSYGVALPVAVQFNDEVAEAARPGVERRLFVTSDPPQPGAWRWFTGRQVLYRPQSYWKPGTKLTVRAALDGVPLGNHRYGDEDHVATGTIARDLEMNVDNKTKSMSVYEGGKLLKTMPVSLGKPSTPSSSGTMVVMERAQQTVFDTRAELGPTEGYRVNIQFAQRITWGGQFIHSAPWSVWDQGRDNVSHGCVNLSPSDAEWLFDRTLVGDPVTVKGTEHKLDPGDGWTAWNMSWASYLKDATR